MQPASSRLDAGIPGQPLLPPAWDSTSAWRADPYRTIGDTCARLGRDAFETRFLLQRTVCMSGPRAAALFNDAQRFRHPGVLPGPAGRGALPDGATGLHLSALLARTTTADRVAVLVRRVRREWSAALPQWAAAGSLPLHQAMQPVLARALCGWAGVPLPPADVAHRTRQLVALFHLDAAVGPMAPLAHLQARRAEHALLAWLTSLVQAARADRLALPDGSAAHACAHQRGTAGALLAPAAAAAALLHLLRPVAALAAGTVGVAHALHVYPEYRAALVAGAPGSTQEFVLEVRRHYPVQAVAAAHARSSFVWDGVRFEPGRRVLLDIHGTRHDARTYDKPDAFYPPRWRRQPPVASTGLGAPEEALPGGPRSAADSLAGPVLAAAVHMLLHCMRYTVPAQPLELRMGQQPALPEGGFVLCNVCTVD